jgi:hypothetical protein
LFLAILSALGEFASAKSDAIEGTISVGEELAGVGAEIPFFTDPAIDQLETHL